ncbi:hypothetical protein RJ639_043465 [Escallonia herrerae]|uniref:Elongator complex protein 6 n=1 Tax=Escallonia herrerae TaxID=1293975 RepID=A0AA88WAF7_9ASTE|nr:hypothetical protein RJ639_043465 [Escallonia herrerae]
MDRSSSLLDEALDFDGLTSPYPSQPGRVVLVEDCVEASGAFILHHLMKRSLSPHSSDAVVFVAFAHPFSHYERILRKMGCNLVVQRDNNRFLFFDMLLPECPGLDGGVGQSIESGLFALYGKIQKAVEVSSLAESKRNVIVMIDDLSLMEVAANGSSNHVMDFLHYCHTLTTQFGCSLVTLCHEDIYSSTERATIPLQVEYLADVIIKAEPLATGLATDVHGQFTVLNKGICDGLGSSRNKMQNFHYRIKENIVEYFYPGSRT